MRPETIVPMLSSKRVRLLSVASAGLVITAGIVVVHFLRVRAGTPEAILTRADQLSWNNQWVAATPLYREAEIKFLREDKPSEALYAQVSQFIPRAESEPIPSLLVQLERLKALPVAQSPDTRLRILVIEGMIETNYDASMARATWQQVEQLARQQGHYLLMARAMGEQGIAAFLLGDLANAKKLVLRAWIAAKYLHDPAAHVRYASVYGAGLVELQRYGEAIRVLDEAINTAARSHGVAYPSIAVNSKIDALRGLHRYHDALTLSDFAIQRLPSKDLDAHLFQIITSKGEVYGDLGQWNDAAAQYALALKYARHLLYWRGVVQTGGLLAEAYEHESNLPAALASINEAIKANKQLPQELYFSPRNLAIKAEILDKMGHTKESHALYERSAELVDSLLATAPTPTVERLLLTEMRTVYTGYFSSLCREGNLTAAFKTIEMARGRVEAKALEHHELIPPHEPTFEERKITQLNLALLETDLTPARTALTQALYEAELQIDNSTMAGRTARRPLELRQIRSHLGPDEMVLEFVLAEPHSCVLAITATGVQKYDLPPAGHIEELVSRYRESIRGKHLDAVTAQALFDAVLAPVAEYKTHHSVIVIPDGQLHLLPFPALIDQGKYVVDDHTFSTSPSATVLCLLRDRESTTLADRFQYIGVAAWGERQPSGSAFLRGVSFPYHGSMASLPATKTEVETIARDFPKSSTVLLGPDATETLFKMLPLEQYRVLHLALHGYADVEYPDRSALVFAPEQGGADDGLLEVREIRNLRLKARLVTLSACNTGVGMIGESDVANLGNAFIEAGAESVVSSLWDLDDNTTERLMTIFYKNLAAHESKSKALRDAQLSLLATGVPPYYWAGLDMSGDPSGEL
jgi:CHAT domain-containing protein